jgi:monoamine oxidase
MNRRQFISNAAWLTAGLQLNAAVARERSCIVVGAGLAGLTAAYRLHAAGWKVTILEARDRVGGRVWSYRFDGAKDLVCEMGAEWVGKGHKKIQALAEELNVPLEPHAYRIWLLQGGQVRPPGEWDYSPQSRIAWKKFKEAFQNYRQSDNLRLDQYDWWTWLGKIGYTDQDRRIHELFDSTDFGESIRQVSAYVAASEYADADANYEKPDNSDEMDYHVVGGNSRLAEALAAKLPAGALHLESPVLSIEQRAGRVTVKTAKDSLTAATCIVTVPASVLRSIHFSPTLPAPKVLAAEELEYSRIVKTQLLFHKRFWPADDFALLSDETAHEYFHTTQRQPGPKGILCSYAIGDKADVLAAQTQAGRQAQLTRDLAAVSATASDDLITSFDQAWQDDPWVHGAYAIYRPGQWFRIRSLLGQRHFNIWFAGEHIAEEQGFMEGAVETGAKAAHDVLTS